MSWCGLPWANRTKRIELPQLRPLDETRPGRQFISAAVPGAGVKPRSPRASAASRPPKLREQFRLAALGARVDFLRIELRAQTAARPRRRRAAKRASAGEVGELLGIGLEVEELRRIRDVVAILPLAEAQHERAGDGADRVILGDHRARRLRALAPRRTAMHRQRRPPTRCGCPPPRGSSARNRCATPASRPRVPPRTPGRRRSAARRRFPRRTWTCPTSRARRRCRRGRWCTSRACRPSSPASRSARSTSPTFSSIDDTRPL